MKKESFWSFTFYFLFLSFSTAQEVPKINKFKGANYLSTHQNWMITQDCEGYLYVANTKGILIYNGFEWQHLTLPKNQKCRAVFRGKDCKIYTGGFEVFGFIDVSNRHEPRFQSLSDSSLHNSNQEIWNIFGNEEQIIFQSFSNIYKYNYQKVSQIIPPSNIMFGKMIDQELYLPKISQGLYSLKDQELTSLEAANQLPLESKIADLCPSHQKGGIILGTQHHGLFLLDEDKLQPLNSELNEQLKKEEINKLIRLSSGSYAIGTILNGVYITRDFKKIENHLCKSNGLANNTVLAIFEDKNKDLWVGLDKGVNQIKISEPLTYIYDRQGKLGTVFNSIHYKDQFYLGTNHGVFKFDENDSFSLVDDSQGQSWSFLILDGDLLCGHNRGTYLIEENHFIPVSNVTGGWCMEAIGEKRILQATYTGLIILEKKEGQWGVAAKVKNGEIQIEKFVLSGNILMGYHPYYGIRVLTFSENFEEVLNEQIFETIDNTPLNEEVQLMASSQALCLSLNDSIYVFEKDSFRIIREEELRSFKKEERFSTRLNFYNSIKTVSKFENISNYQFIKPEDALDHFIVGFEEGYIVIPKSYKNEKDAPTDIAVDFITVNGQGYSQPQNLSFAATQNNLSIQLKDNAFNNLHFPLKYKLFNWDSQWHPIPANGKLNFINLDDGTYQLQVSSSGKSKELLQFSIAPHWYESWPGAILFSALTIFLIWYFNKRAQEKLEMQSEKLHQEKEREIESERMKSKNENLEREILFKSKMLVNSTMALIQKNKMLGELKMVIAKETSNTVKNRSYRQKILNLIDRNIDSDQDWEIFERNFAAVHLDFLEKLKSKYPNITAGELKLAAYIRMNLSSKEIAPLLNISVRSVENKRYRLRKKMGIEHHDNLSDHLLRL